MPMVDILVTANGYKADDAIELITRPLEDIVKGINGVEHVYSQTQDDRVMVTARFFVGTQEDNARPARAREDPRQYRRPAQGHSRTADRRPRHRRRRDRRAHAVAQARARRRAGPTTDSIQIAEELQHELAKVDEYRAELHRRRQPQTRSASSPIRSGSPSTASRSISSSTSSPTPTARSRSAPSARTTATCRWSPARRCRACPTSACCC